MMMGRLSFNYSILVYNQKKGDVPSSILFANGRVQPGRKEIS